MADLSVKVCGVEFNNPLIAASGTFGFGMEYSELYPLEKLGISIPKPNVPMPK